MNFSRKKKPQYTVLNEADFLKYCNSREIENAAEALRPLFYKIEKERIREGKLPINQYIVINRDESYAPEVIEIMKRHGHWG